MNLWPVKLLVRTEWSKLKVGVTITCQDRLNCKPNAIWHRIWIIFCWDIIISSSGWSWYMYPYSLGCFTGTRVILWLIAPMIIQNMPKHMQWNGNVIILTKFSSLAALRKLLFWQLSQCSQWWKFNQNDDIIVSVDHAYNSWDILSSVYIYWRVLLPTIWSY